MTLAVAPKEIEGHGLLNGKVVVVTAAAGTGIGSAVARRALAEGADVVVSDHHERRLGETRDQLTELGLGRVESVVCDVTSTAQVDALIASTTARMGRLDVLVNNAGLGGTTPVVDMTDEEWDRVLNVTLTSTMRATRAALRYFRDADHGGVIVNNASVLGWRAQHSQSHYAAAKAGVMALTRCSAIEAVEFGVRINAVSPSIARHKFLEKTSSSELLDQLSAVEAFGRAAEPWEVAATSHGSAARPKASSSDSRSNSSELLVFSRNLCLAILGDTALIRTPYSTASIALQRVRAITPALAAA